VAAVLLVALGSDYNVFAVGHAWEEARHRPLRKALAATLPQSARTIRIAGLTLAVSFGLLTIVPLRPFREIAFAMSVGILIDALVVRSLVVPAVLTLAGSASGWPGRHLASRREPVPATADAPAEDQDAPVP
jgi:RND superfamily putative drug exporter